MTGEELLLINLIKSLCSLCSVIKQKEKFVNIMIDKHYHAKHLLAMMASYETLLIDANIKIKCAEIP